MFLDIAAVISHLSETLSREITKEVLGPIARTPKMAIALRISMAFARYTDAVLTWWRTHAGAIKDWAHAARIVFAMSPNSASCERVFSLLNLMYGDQQVSTLADSIRAGLMLRYNGRKG